MNQHKAIAAVTDTLRSVLNKGRRNLPGLESLNAPVTIGPPGKVPDDREKRVNLFLYSTAVNPDWRNMDLPGKVKPGETGRPALALDLHYLLTAYGEDNARADSHELLGRAMSILHDSPLLNADEIKYNDGTEEYVHRQIERIRITPDPLTLDEMTKLWSSFQQDYRISTTYKIGVVLIESTLPTKTPPPVRRRGREDAGSDTPERIGTHPNTLPPFPTILSIKPAGGQPSLETGEGLVVNGFNFTQEAGEMTTLEIHQKSADGDPVVSITPTGHSATEIAADLPEDERLSPGPVTVAVVFTTAAGTTRRSSAFPAALAPKLTGVGGATKDERGIIAIKFQPKLRVTYQGRREEGPSPARTVLRPAISLLLGGDEIAFNIARINELFEGEESVVVGDIEFPIPVIEPPSSGNTGETVQRTIDTEVLVFVAETIPAPDSLVRLRVDGIDSLLIADRTVSPPRFRGPPDFVEPRVTIPDNRP